MWRKPLTLAYSSHAFRLANSIARARTGTTEKKRSSLSRIGSVGIVNVDATIAKSQEYRAADR